MLRTGQPLEVVYGYKTRNAPSSELSLHYVAMNCHTSTFVSKRSRIQLDCIVGHGQQESADVCYRSSEHAVPVSLDSRHEKEKKLATY
ncbi:hypothetical protein TMatcc_000970 [Talaromyces marneffei ATCC 18224]